MVKSQNLRLLILLEYQNNKTFLQKAMFQIGLKKFLWFKKLKTLCMLLVIYLMNQIKKRLKKLIKEKGDKLYVQWKGYNSSFLQLYW